MDIDIQKKYLPSQNAAYRIINGEAVIVDTRAGKILTLNETGSEIWSLLEDKNLNEIADEVEKIFKIDKNTALQDTIEFVTMLKDRGLVA
jgi:hypothetical protein